MITRASNELVALAAKAPVAEGTPVHCDLSDTMVFVRNGAVLGIAGPNVHLMTAQELPFLAAARTPTGYDVSVYFVRTAPDWMRVGHMLPPIADPRGAQPANASVMLEINVGVRDPARLVGLVVEHGPTDLEQAVTARIEQSAIEATHATATAFVQHSQNLSSLNGAAASDEFVRRLRHGFWESLSQQGLEFFDIRNLVIVPAQTAAAAAPTDGARVAQAKRYEMLWDCQHCGKKKNLGLTHRHCPNCGVPQPAEARYFPSEDEKVAVENHEYVGADFKCAYCGNYSSRKARNCGSCGAPLAEGSDVQRQATQKEPFASEKLDVPVATAAKKSSSFVAMGCGALVLAGVIIAALALFWKKDGAVEVTGHAWVREISIERFGPVEESKWCNEVPGGVSILRRSREVRSREQVPDGQECRMQRVDNGDGTYSERQECRPKYREEPVYDDKCYYNINRWAFARKASATGQSLAQSPSWPVVSLAGAGECIGCERESGRTESYLVRFRTDGAHDASDCQFDQTRWAGFAVGSKWTGKLSMITGALDCSTLR